MVRVVWTSLHMKVDDNVGTDSMAGVGKRAHAYMHKQCCSEEPSLTDGMWDTWGYSRWLQMCWTPQGILQVSGNRAGRGWD